MRLFFESKNKIRLLQIRSLFFLILLILFSLFFNSQEVVFGVVIGSFLSLGNIFVLEKTSELIFFKIKPRKILVILVYFIKIIFLFVVLFFLMNKKIINPLAFIIGFSSPFLVIAMEAAYSFLKNNLL